MTPKALSREIKFKSIDEDLRMTKIMQIDSSEYRQFTGLHDKNGKEIYENDYLGDWCVYWGSGKYILQNISTGDIIDCNENTTRDKEVTGNKYETSREHPSMASDL